MTSRSKPPWSFPCHRVGPMIEPMAEEDGETPADRAENPEFAELVEAYRDCARLFAGVTTGCELLERRDLALARESATHFWRAATYGWSAERHARVYLLELLRQVPFAGGYGSEGAPEFLRTHLDAIREVFDLDCPTASNASAQDRDVWFAFWVFYPESARLLTCDLLATARRLQRGELPNKWIELSEILDRIGLGKLKPDSLSSEDRQWRRLRAGSEISAASQSEKPDPAR